MAILISGTRASRQMEELLHRPEPEALWLELSEQRTERRKRRQVRESLGSSILHTLQAIIKTVAFTQNDKGSPWKVLNRDVT